MVLVSEGATEKPGPSLPHAPGEEHPLHTCRISKAFSPEVSRRSLLAGRESNWTLSFVGLVKTNKATNASFPVLGCLEGPDQREALVWMGGGGKRKEHTVEGMWLRAEGARCRLTLGIGEAFGREGTCAQSQTAPEEMAVHS